MIDWLLIRYYRFQLWRATNAIRDTKCAIWIEQQRLPHLLDHQRDITLALRELETPATRMTDW